MLIIYYYLFCVRVQYQWKTAKQIITIIDLFMKQFKSYLLKCILSARTMSLENSKANNNIRTDNGMPIIVAHSAEYLIKIVYKVNKLYS